MIVDCYSLYSVVIEWAYARIGSYVLIPLLLHCTHCTSMWHYVTVGVCCGVCLAYPLRSGVVDTVLLKYSPLAPLAIHSINLTSILPCYCVPLWCCKCSVLLSPVVFVCYCLMPLVYTSCIQCQEIQGRLIQWYTYRIARWRWEDSNVILRLI